MGNVYSLFLTPTPSQLKVFWLLKRVLSIGRNFSLSTLLSPPSFILADNTPQDS